MMAVARSSRAVPQDLNRVISSGVFAPLHGAPAEVKEIALDLGEIKLPLVAGLQQVAGFGQGTFSRVHKNPGAGHHVAIGFAHGGLEGPGKVHMGAGFEPFAPDDGFCGGRHAGHDIGLTHRGFQIGDGRCLKSFAFQFTGKGRRLFR